MWWQFMGPFLGGLALQNLPQTKEIRCAVGHEEFCRSGFRAAITVFASLCAFVALSFFLLVSPPPPSRPLTTTSTSLPHGHTKKGVMAGQALSEEEEEGNGEEEELSSLNRP